MLEKVLQAKLNTVMVSMPPVNQNYGEGDVGSFFSFVTESKKANLVVFGWISNHKRTYPTPADLRLEEERQAQAKWVEDVLTSYPCLDGIAIDYIRYPTWEPSNKEKIDGVTATVEIIRGVTDRFGVVLLTTCFPAATITYRGTEPNWEGDIPLWYQEWFRADPYNYFVQEATSGGTGIVNQGNLNGSHPDFLLGPSFMSYQQDPITWMNNGFVQHVVPMQYTADTTVMQNDINVWESFAAWYNLPMSSFYLGLGWFDEPSSFPDSKFDPAAMIAHLNYGRLKGYGGATIFRLGIPDTDDSPLIEALTIPNADNNWNPPYVTETSPPFSNLQRKCLVEIPRTIASAAVDSTNVFVSILVTVFMCDFLLR
jgi:hypothetical protein